MVLPIIAYGDPILKKEAVDIEQDYPNLDQLIENMFETMADAYGVGLAADTGPARGNGMWIDLGYSDHDWEHWARYTDVYILTPVPETIDYILPQ